MVCRLKQRLSGTVSLNAAMFASTLLASRLRTTYHVFAFVLLAMEIFALFPIVRETIRVRGIKLLSQPGHACTFAVIPFPSLYEDTNKRIACSPICAASFRHGVLVWDVGPVRCHHTPIHSRQHNSGSLLLFHRSWYSICVPNHHDGCAAVQEV